MLTIEELNRLDQDEFVKLLGEIFEHSPWIAKKAEKLRPFPTVDALHQQMVEIVQNATKDEKLELIRAHPNLGEKMEMSADSNKEQQGAGLKNLTEEEYQSFLSLNKAYTEKFAFPFIFAVKGKTKHDIHQAMKERINHSISEEYEAALAEIYKIAKFRLNSKMLPETVEPSI
ncbi:2-oxo-4-hydroxy-4-carboxy-5-ureidoimidazoline decarboxylase [Sediminibacillus massiliensis]|uniref:2-oxo-4-hydroxy-4-carboxy-5-ureidoimidazoline decarboxylase n=1 Tax=Sediminibacillus massiliensis TaxID=1926277 RepID=UPI0009884A40|nr:2-oxo-4-hydroxy-4-carboxy-5-ureidoimidazoline decarboxylase [Sediminibacillus massiliensis]